MDLFRDIKKGKKFTPKELKHEAAHELKELGGENAAEAHEKKVKMAKRMKPKIKFYPLHKQHPIGSIFKGVTDPLESARRPFERKHTPHGEISHPWQIKKKDNR